jgi:hypothetical protein
VGGCEGFGAEGASECQHVFYFSRQEGRGLGREGVNVGGVCGSCCLVQREPAVPLLCVLYVFRPFVRCVIPIVSFLAGALACTALAYVLFCIIVQ